MNILKTTSVKTVTLKSIAPLTRILKSNPYVKITISLSDMGVRFFVDDKKATYRADFDSILEFMSYAIRVGVYNHRALLVVPNKATFTKYEYRNITVSDMLYY